MHFHLQLKDIQEELDNKEKEVRTLQQRILIENDKKGSKSSLMATTSNVSILHRERLNNNINTVTLGSSDTARHEENRSGESYNKQNRKEQALQQMMRETQRHRQLNRESNTTGMRKPDCSIQ